MQNNISPEERLLKLIRKSAENKNAAKQGEAGSGALKNHNSTDENISKIQKHEEQVKEETNKINRNFNRKKPETFKIILIFMVLCIAFIMFYAVYELFFKQEQPMDIDIDKLISQQQAAEVLSQQEPEKPGAQVSNTESDTNEKNGSVDEEIPPQLKQLFGAPVTRQQDRIEQQGPTIAELAQNFSLLGVITGDDPQAIIQDKKTKQTYYVYKNEQILDFTIKEIEKATVVLEYNGKTIKLSL